MRMAMRTMLRTRMMEAVMRMIGTVSTAMKLKAGDRDKGYCQRGRTVTVSVSVSIRVRVTFVEESHETQEGKNTASRGLREQYINVWAAVSSSGQRWAEGNLAVVIAVVIQLAAKYLAAGMEGRKSQAHVVIGAVSSYSMKA